MTAAVPAAPQPPPAPCGCLHEFEHGPLCGPRPGSAARPLTAPDVVAGLLADVAESRAQLADAAPELAAAMAETRAVRDGYQDLCGEFGPSAQSGWSARISLTVLNRHRDRAGLPGLPRNAAAGDREDITMRYRRERDEACAQLAEVRKLAESWAGRAPAARSIAEDLMTPPRDSVSADCGRELLTFLEADGGA